MKPNRRSVLLGILLIVWFGLPVIGHGAEDRDMVLDGINGDVTARETESFIYRLSVQQPPPTTNVGNLMADEKDGARLHGMQTFYSFTHDRRALDVAIVWTDAFLHARNDPISGRIIWTGKRDLCWPNKATTDEQQALHSGSENGDVIEHIVNTAKMILENPAIWNMTAPADKYGYGATYLDRAKTYVRKCQRSAETTIVPWFVRNTNDGYRLYYPDSPDYFKWGGESGPLPWNQQQMVAGALLRLAQCHRLLNDGNTNIAYYEKIVADAAAWFFSAAMPVSSRGKVCYDWSYVLNLDIATEPEDSNHADYDVMVFQAYRANLGPTRLEMQRLINTARFVRYLGPNRFAGQMNGTSNERRYERKFLNFEWIEMSVLDRQLYDMAASAVLSSHEYWDNIPVEAAVLEAKHYWATNPVALPEIADDATGIPPVPQVSELESRPLRYLRHMPFQGYCLLVWVGSELMLSLFKRSRGNAVSKDRGSLRLIWMVNVVAFAAGIHAAYHLLAWRIRWPVILEIGYGLFAAGLLLRWYSVIYLGRFFTTNVAIAPDHRVIDTGPYRWIRHPSYTGGMLAIPGWCLAAGNWASLAIIFLPAFAVQLWRIRIEERALLEGLGEPYGNYMQRTKRLVPLIY